MGLPLSVLRLIARVHNTTPLSGPVLTLGRQAIYATHAEVCALWKSEGIAPIPTPPDALLTTNIPAWTHGPNAKFTNDRVVFQTLAGAEVFALDVSPYEDADYIFDLNHPIPVSWNERFGLIVDTGTLEHVFDIKQALININKMLRAGGRVIHASPGNNWMQHGFYQFSPTFFYDYYGANHFVSPDCYLIEMTKTCMEKDHRLPCNCWKWDVKRPYGQLFSEHTLTVFFTAEKTNDSTDSAIPQQGDFLKVGMGGRLAGDGGTVSPNMLSTTIKKHLPWRVKQMIKRRLHLDITIKPWGLNYIGKI